MSVYDAKSIPAEVNSSTKDPEVAAFLKTGPVQTGAGLMAAPDRSSSSTRAWDEKLDGETK